MEPEKMTLNISEVAQALGVSRPTVYRMVHMAGFPCFRVGARVLIPKEALREWVNAQAQKEGLEP